MGAFDQLPIIEDPEEARCPCLLLLDVSGSMSGPSIEQLNKGIRQFAVELGNNALASKRVELAVVTFGGAAEVRQDFVSARDFRPEELVATGGTPMGDAINKGLDLLDARKKVYRANGVTYYRPWVFLITDGGPDSGWEPSAKRLINAEKNKSVTTFCVGVAGANFEVLKEFGQRKPVQLQGLKFAEFFTWLSSSLATASASEPGLKVEMADPSDWMSAPT